MNSKILAIAALLLLPSVCLAQHEGHEGYATDGRTVERVDLDTDSKPPVPLPHAA